MKQLIAHLRDTERRFRAAETVGTRSAIGGHIVDQLPQLLDRLEALDEMLKQGKALRGFVEKHLNDNAYRTASDDEHAHCLMDQWDDALAALEEKN